LNNNQPKFFIDDLFFDELKPLPWHLPLDEWKPDEVDFIDFRKGLSRHTVRFIKGKNASFAIKETTELKAKQESDNFEKILKLGLHTLIPVGYVVYDRPPIQIQTPIGTNYIRDESAFIITLLENKALPDSYLYKLNFKEVHRKRIWHAVAELLASLHFHGVYWGDASLANILVRFFKVRDEKGRVRTELKAILADAETVEILPDISPEMRKQDLDFFFESMTWLNEDYINAGITREKFSTTDDKKFILKNYNRHYKLLRKIRSFEKKTGLEVRRNFKIVKDIRFITSVKKQIDEHKWYLSERAGREISLKTAAFDWLKHVYFPILDEFEKLNIFEYFPFKTSTGLYVDIMTHKYFLSEKKGMDIGIEQAIKDYTEKFASDKSFTDLVSSRIKRITKLFY